MNKLILPIVLISFCLPMVAMFGCTTPTPTPSPTAPIPDSTLPATSQPSILGIAGYKDHRDCLWRIGLTSANIEKSKLTISVFIINDGESPSFFYDTLIVVDSFNEAYLPESGRDFSLYANSEAKQNALVTKIYPGEVREGELTFAISEYSGECSLCVADYMQNKLRLFDIPLGE